MVPSTGINSNFGGAQIMAPINASQFPQNQSLAIPLTAILPHNGQLANQDSFIILIVTVNNREQLLNFMTATVGGSVAD